MTGPGMSGEVPGDVWDALLEAGERRVYRDGAALFLEGDPPGPVIAIVAGGVRVVAGGPAHVELGDFGPRSILGEIAAIDGLPRSATAIAIARTEVVAVDAPRFNALLADHPALSLWVLRVLAARLRAATITTLQWAADPVEIALASTIVDLVQTRGVDTGAIAVIDVRHAELATRLGTDPETTSKAIARLQARGLVLPERDRLHVVNLDALSRLAHASR